MLCKAERYSLSRAIRPLSYKCIHKNILQQHPHRVGGAHVLKVWYHHFRSRKLGHGLTIYSRNLHQHHIHRSYKTDQKLPLTSRAVQTDIIWPRGQDVPTEVSTTSASTQTVSDVSKPNTVWPQHKSATDNPLPKRKEDKMQKKKKSSKSTSPRRSQSASCRGTSPSPTRENQSSSTSGRGRIVRQHLPVTTSNKFDGLEHMEISPESSTRSRSISPISPPGGSG